MQKMKEVHHQMRVSKVKLKSTNDQYGVELDDGDSSFDENTNASRKGYKKRSNASSSSAQQYDFNEPQRPMTTNAQLTGGADKNR